jgi:predicted ArsR family transcriptional regulator
VTDKSGCTLERRVTPKMVDIPVPRYHSLLTDTYNKLKSEYQQLIGQFSDADAQLKQLFKVIRDIEEMARYTPASVGESEQLLFIVSTGEENRQNFCKVLKGKNLFSALYGTYTVALHEC